MKKTKYGVYMRIDERDHRCPPFLIYMFVSLMAALAGWGPIGDGILAFAPEIIDWYDWIKSFLI